VSTGTGLLPLAYALAAAGYAGFQLTIRAVVYPQFARVPAPAFPAYEGAHQRSVTPLVGLLFGALAVTTAGLLLLGPRPAGTAAAVLLAALLGVTAFGAVPEHGRLSRAFDPLAHRRLLRWDALRVVIALAQVALGVVTVLAH
jgi:hypothetical protein